MTKNVPVVKTEPAMTLGYIETQKPKMEIAAAEPASAAKTTGKNP